VKFSQKSLPMESKHYKRVAAEVPDSERQEKGRCKKCGKESWLLGNEGFSCPQCGHTEGTLMDARRVGHLDITSEKRENK